MFFIEKGERNKLLDAVQDKFDALKKDKRKFHEIRY